MEVSFSKNPNEVVTETQTVETPVPGVTVDCQTYSCGVPATQVGPLLGDKIPSFDEIKLARINLAQNIGVLGAHFDPGSIIFDQRIELFIPQKMDAKTGNVSRAASKPVTVCVLGFKATRFCEKTSGGVPGIIVATEEEVRKAGGTLDYKEWQLKAKDGMKRFEQLADALVAIQRPESITSLAEGREDDPDFGFIIDGKQYALALWALRGTAYTAAAKGVFFRDRAMGCLRAGYPTWHYAVSSFEKAFGGTNKAWVPVCIPVAKSSEAFLAFARDVLNPAQ
jgi:hypothetical protein